MCSKRTHHHCGLNRLLTLISSIGAPLWPKQTTHFYTIHRAESHHNTIVSSESDQNRLFALHMAQLVSNCKPHQKIDIILTMTEKTMEELKPGPRANLINCEIKARGATMTYVETSFGPVRPPGTSSCTGPILSHNSPGLTLLQLTLARVNSIFL